MRAASLKHETLDDSVEVQTVVVALLHQVKEIARRDGHGFGEEFDGDVAGGRFHEDLHGGTTERHLKRICLPCGEAHVHIGLRKRTPMTHLLDEPFLTMNGETTTLRNLGGERWLVVNVASACGATPQYAGLQELHETHKALTVVGFPCNQFGAQEPGTHDEICEFTSSKYNVSFPLMAKVDVNGPNRLSLFERLCQTAVDGGEPGDVRWNFEKFLIDGEGNVERFSTRAQPDALGL